MNKLQTGSITIRLESLSTFSLNQVPGAPFFLEKLQKLARLLRKLLKHSDLLFMKEQQKILDILAIIAGKKITTHQSQLSTLYEQKKAFMQQILIFKNQGYVNQVAA